MLMGMGGGWIKKTGNGSLQIVLRLYFDHGYYSLPSPKTLCPCHYKEETLKTTMIGLCVYAFSEKEVGEVGNGRPGSVRQVAYNLNQVSVLRMTLTMLSPFSFLAQINELWMIYCCLGSMQSIRVWAPLSYSHTGAIRDKCWDAQCLWEGGMQVWGSRGIRPGVGKTGWLERALCPILPYARPIRRPWNQFLWLF